MRQDLLDGRTSDGLPLILGVSFQYQLRADGHHLYQLYSTYEQNVGDYEQVYGQGLRCPRLRQEKP